MKKIRVWAWIVFLSMSFLSCHSKPKSIQAPNERILRYPINAKLGNLDPHTTTGVYDATVESLVYESLYELHFLKRPYEASPLLAASLPKISADKKKLKIELKKGIHYQDDPCFENGKGREITAQDAIDMFERISARGFNSPIYSSFEHRIVGIDDYHSGKAKHISGIRKIDRYSFEIELTQVLPRFIYNFVDAKTALIARECIEKYGAEFPQHSVGTGAFHMTYFEPATKASFVKNPNYHTAVYPFEGMPGDREKGLLADAGKQLPLLDKVSIEVMIEDQPKWLRFLAGETDMSLIPYDNTATALPGGKLSAELANRGVRNMQAPRGDVTMQVFNLEDPVWGKKKELRQAFALAIDRKKLANLIYAGQAIVAQSLIDPTEYGYDPKFKSKWANRDLDKARALLAKAGYPDGKGLPALINVAPMSSRQREIDEFYAHQLAEVGIVFKDDVVTWPELERKTREKQFVTSGFALASDVPDADSTFPSFHCKNKAPGVNYASYCNPVVDRLIDEVEEMENGPARLAKIRKVQEIIDEDLPFISILHRLGNKVVQPWVRNAIFIDENFVGTYMKYLDVVPSK